MSITTNQSICNMMLMAIPNIWISYWKYNYEKNTKGLITDSIEVIMVAITSIVVNTTIALSVKFSKSK